MRLLVVRTIFRFLGRKMFLLVLLTSTLSIASTTQNSLDSTLNTFDHSHKLWTNILEQFTSTKGQSTVVNYKNLKKDSYSLNAYLKNLESISYEQFNKFSNNQQLAFLINTYNAYTIKLILDNYPIKSIRKIGSFFGSPWKIEFIALFGKKRSLDYIEHDLIRAKYNEPRIHFAVVCASIGCPALRREAYVEQKLESQLEDAATQFLTDKSKNRFIAEKKILELSSIFDWYGKDFEKKFGSIEAFIADRITSKPEERRAIKAKESTVHFLEYDWALNE